MSSIAMPTHALIQRTRLRAAGSRRDTVEANCVLALVADSGADTSARGLSARVPALVPGLARLHLLTIDQRKHDAPLSPMVGRSAGARPKMTFSPLLGAWTRSAKRLPSRAGLALSRFGSRRVGHYSNNLQPRWQKERPPCRFQ
jgi:hypothetical protein